MAKSKKDFSNQAQGMGFNAWFQKTDGGGEEEQKTPPVEEGKSKAKSIQPPAEKDEAISAPSTKKSKRAARAKAVAAKPASEKGCKEGDTRKTFIIRKDLAEQIQDVAYWEPGKLKDHVNAALEAYVKKKWTKKRPKGA